MGSGDGSGAGGGSGCLKCILIVLNLVFGLIGVVFLGIGIFIYVGLDNLLNNLIGGQLESLNSIMSNLALQGGNAVADNEEIKFTEILGDFGVPFIVVGCFILACAIIGCCGACCSSKTLLIVYIIVCSILLLVQIILVSLFFTGKLETPIKKQIQTAIDKDFKGIDDIGPWSLLFNFLMAKFKCCGIESYKDFDSAANWEKTRVIKVNDVDTTFTMTTPMACCVFDGEFPNLGQPKDKMCMNKLQADLNNFDKGCWSEVNTELKQYKTTIVGALCGILIAQLIIILIAVVILRCDHGNETDTV